MFQFEDYTLDIARGSLRTADREVQLRPKSFEVLRYLVENADRLVTKEELIKAIWPNVVVTDKSLTHCISEVRKAIGDSKQAIIATVPRRGYRLVAAVSRLATTAPAVPHLAPPAVDTAWAPSLSTYDRNRLYLIGPLLRSFPSSISAATCSTTISATALPKTSSRNCRGFPAVGHRAQLDVPVQGEGARYSAGWRRVRRAVRAGGKRQAERRSCPH